MGYFNRGNNSGGSRGGRRFEGRGPGRDSRRRDSGRPSMHRAICDECGESCEVPFKPSGDKPVYCSNCFEDMGNEKRGRVSKTMQRLNSDEKPLHGAKCDGCGKYCEVPFKPTGKKPIYCDQCFEDNKKTKTEASKDYTEQFDILNAKLDKILKALSPILSRKEDKEEAEDEKGKEEDKPKKTPTKKAATKKSTAKKTATKKTTAQKSTTKKVATKKAATKKK